MSDFFNQAYRQARARFSTEQWLALSPQQITDTIYRAMREIDAAAVQPAGNRGDGRRRPRDRQDEP